MWKDDDFLIDLDFTVDSREKKTSRALTETRISSPWLSVLFTASIILLKEFKSRAEEAFLASNH